MKVRASFVKDGKTVKSYLVEWDSAFHGNFLSKREFADLADRFIRDGGTVVTEKAEGAQ